MIRLAEIGDHGIVQSEQTSSGSGLATLTLEAINGDVLLLLGDWRCLQDIFQDLEGQKVEVTEGEGSSWGCHDLQPVAAASADSLLRDA